MERPRITTAIPKRRFKLGEFTAVLLGEIESGDDWRYDFIMGAVRDGDSEPCVYVTCERTQGVERQQGRQRLRVVLPEQAKVVGYGDQWRLGDFEEQAMGLLRQLLQIEDEEVLRLT